MSATENIGAMVYLPGEKKIEAYDAKNLESFTEIENYWMKSEGMVFFPFDRSRQAFFFSKKAVENPVKEFEFSPNVPMSRQEYVTSVFLAQECIKQGDFTKVVLARNEIISGQFDAEASFHNAVTHHSDSHCFYVDLGEQKWVGASPELLVHFEEGVVYTVALAGTRLLDQEFSNKEHEEQHMVEDFVEDKMREVGLGNFVKSEKQEALFSHIKHLKTAYTIQATPDQALALIKVLHPTSAVCGLPRDTSFNFIQEFEAINRSFYSGLTGVLKKDSATFFVNLRCMRFFHDHVELFAGAGITKESKADEEWDETERKIHTIKELL